MEFSYRQGLYGRPVYEGHGIINEMPEFGGTKKGIRPVIVIDLNKL